MMKLIAVVLVVFSQFPPQYALKIKPRIVNGCIAKEQQFPHYVFMKMKITEEKFRTCGGTLLNDEFILTAAHCLKKATSIDLFLGTADLRTPHHIVVVDEENFFEHPHSFIGSHDIGAYIYGFFNFTKTILYFPSVVLQV